MYFGKMHDKIINERISCYFREIFLWDSSFLCDRNFLLHKNASQDAHSREEEICSRRPHSARECTIAHSLKFIDRIKVLWQNNGMEMKTILERCKMRNVTGAEEQ
jgi:hypothetical protein